MLIFTLKNAQKYVNIYQAFIDAFQEEIQTWYTTKRQCFPLIIANDVCRCNAFLTQGTRDFL